MSGESQRCRVCGLNFVMGVTEDSEQHRQMHAEILQGGFPLAVREILKSAGYVVMARHPLGRMSFEVEEGKQAVVFGWWSRARARGLPDSDFREFFSAHFEYLDAQEAKDSERIEDAKQAISKWGIYAG